MHSELRQPSRPAPTWRQILNPIWLLGDDKRPAAWGWWAHFWRNPAYNLIFSVIGLGARERIVWWARGAGWTLAERGWNYGASLPVGGWFARPFISYRGTVVELVLGWKTSGALSCTLRRADSPNQAEKP